MCWMPFSRFRGMRNTPQLAGYVLGGYPHGASPFGFEFGAVMVAKWGFRSLIPRGRSLSKFQIFAFIGALD